MATVSPLLCWDLGLLLPPAPGLGTLTPHQSWPRVRGELCSHGCSSPIRPTPCDFL